MTEATSGPREPDGSEPARTGSAGAAESSGDLAARAPRDPGESDRLTQQQLDERDARFSRPRKPQGPPLGPGAAPAARGGPPRSTDEVPETPPPSVGSPP